MKDLNVNLNQTQVPECLKEINNIGNTIYQNVCTGTSHLVPWGIGNWLINGMLFILIAGTGILLGTILISLFKYEI